MFYIYSWATFVVIFLMWGIRGYNVRQRSIDMILNIHHQRIEQLENALNITEKEDLNG